MRLSCLFTKTQRGEPRDEKSINAKLLIKAGFIDKLMTGVYSYLPLGFRVIKKIENIIREEMNKINGQEVFLPALQPKDIWTKTNRWQYEEMFKLKSRGGKDYSLGWTHEEVIVPLVQKFVKSYKDLPVFVYQIQDKFRDELRAKSGLLRVAEFLMKDLYSFHRDEIDLDKYYEKAKKAYLNVFKRCGLQKNTFPTLASGGTFSKYSHEFQTMTPAGEDTIYLCRKCKIAVNKEIIEEEKYKCPQCGNKNLEIKKAIEVGNIFKLRDKFTRAFNFTFRDKDGKEKIVMMGCYGIGLGRLMGAIVEVFHDEDGIIWPPEVAPFKVHLISLDGKDTERYAEKIYKLLNQSIGEVLYDNRDLSTGIKLKDADLIGCPIRLVVSRKNISKNLIELKMRNKKKEFFIKTKELIKKIKSI